MCPWQEGVSYVVMKPMTWATEDCGGMEMGTGTWPALKYPFQYDPLLLGQGAQDLPEMPPQLVVERFVTILRKEHYLILAVPLGMA
jgi:hypothetical protein